MSMLEETEFDLVIVGDVNQVVVVDDRVNKAEAFELFSDNVILGNVYIQ